MPRKTKARSACCATMVAPSADSCAGPTSEWPEFLFLRGVRCRATIRGPVYSWREKANAASYAVTQAEASFLHTIPAAHKRACQCSSQAPRRNGNEEQHYHPEH